MRVYKLQLACSILFAVYILNVDSNVKTLFSQIDGQHIAFLLNLKQYIDISGLKFTFYGRINVKGINLSMI